MGTQTRPQDPCPPHHFLPCLSIWGQVREVSQKQERKGPAWDRTSNNVDRAAAEPERMLSTSDSGWVTAGKGGIEWTPRFLALGGDRSGKAAEGLVLDRAALRDVRDVSDIRCGPAGGGRSPLKLWRVSGGGRDTHYSAVPLSGFSPHPGSSLFSQRAWCG